MITIAGSSGVMFAPASLPWTSLNCFVLIGVGLGLVKTLMWSMEADTVEYGEWATGACTGGATYAVFSFVRKLGQAFGGAVAAYTTGLAGYVGGAAMRSGTVLWGIQAAAGSVSAGCVLLAIAIMMAYPLTQKRFREITEDVAQRRTARDAESTTASVT